MNENLYRKFHRRNIVKYSLWAGFWIVAGLIVLYSICWFVSLSVVSSTLNTKYANQDINVIDAKSEYGYFVKFTKAQPTGFPFKFAIKLTGWQEESRSNKIEYQAPLIVGYNLLKGNIFVSFAGEINAWYKPVQAGFGAKIVKDNFVLSAKLPLNIKLIKLVMRNSDWFQIINFIKNFECRSDKVKIFDFVDNKKLYDADVEFFEAYFVRSKFYTDLDDFLSNIPQKLNIIYSTKVNYISKNNRLTPENLLHSYVLPFTFNGDSTITLTTNAKNFADLKNDIEVSFSYIPNPTAKEQFNPNVFYKYKSDNSNTDIAVKATTSFTFSKGFFNDLFIALQYASDNVPNTQIGIILKNSIAYVLNHKDQFTLKALEEKNYDFDLDFAFARRTDQLYTQVNNLSIFSGNNGIRLNNHSIIETAYPAHWNSKGVVLIYNYEKIVDVVSSNIYVLKHTEGSSIQKQKLYLDVAKYFLKTISDHPTSKSSDLSFEYDLDSTNITKSKIGNTEFGKITILYYLALYKKAIAQLKSGENLLGIMQEFAPALDQNHQQFLEQLMLKPFEVDKETWEELVQ